MGSELKGTPVTQTQCPVIGGHAGATILPLLSQVEPSCEFTDEERAALTVRIQNAGTEVVEAKAGGGSATLSMAYAAARFADSIIRAMNGEELVEFAYIPVENVPGVDVDYFSCALSLAADGSVKKNLGLGTLNAYENDLVAAANKQSAGEIAKGIEFAANFE